MLTISLLILLSAALHICAEYANRRRMIYVFKPLTTTLILLLCATCATSGYAAFILAGLLCSLAGDIFLMLPQDRFIPGLLSFLGAHIFYIAAFTLGTGFQVTLFIVIPVAAGIAMFLTVLPHVAPSLKIPVIAYMLVILTMFWQALEQAGLALNLHTILMLSGAALFALSDSALAYNRFVAPFRHASLVVLGTYYAAQWCLATSARFW